MTKIDVVQFEEEADSDRAEEKLSRKQNHYEQLFLGQ